MIRTGPRLAPIVRALRLSAALAALAFLLFLPFAGRALHDEDPLQKADLIMVLAGARVERWLEGVELYKEGWAPQLVLSSGGEDPAEDQLRARGVHFPREGDLARDAVVALGVPAAAVRVFPHPVDNTAHEAVMLHQMLGGDPPRRVIVVTSVYHTRRTGFAFRRAFRGTGVEILVRASRFSRSEPTRWWRRRGDIRYVFSELPKLAAYAAGVAE